MASSGILLRSVPLPFFKRPSLSVESEFQKGKWQEGRFGELGTHRRF